MDPTLNSIVGPWAQFGIVGSVVLALGVVCWTLMGRLHQAGKDHLAAVQACADRHADLLTKKLESDNALANALERISDRIPKS